MDVNIHINVIAGTEEAAAASTRGPAHAASALPRTADEFYGLKFVRGYLDVGLDEKLDAIIWDEPKAFGAKSYALYGAAQTVAPQDAFTGMHVFLPEYAPIKAGDKLQLRIAGDTLDITSDLIEVPGEDGGEIDPAIKDLAFVMEAGKVAGVKWSSPDTGGITCVARNVNSAGAVIGDYLSAVVMANEKTVLLRRAVYDGEVIKVMTATATGSEYSSNLLTVPAVGGTVPPSLETLTRVSMAGGIITWAGQGYVAETYNMGVVDKHAVAGVDRDVCRVDMIDYSPGNTNRAYIKTTVGVPFRLALYTKGAAGSSVLTGVSAVITPP